MRLAHRPTGWGKGFISKIRRQCDNETMTGAQRRRSLVASHHASGINSRNGNCGGQKGVIYHKDGDHIRANGIDIETQSG